MRHFGADFDVVRRLFALVVELQKLLAVERGGVVVNVALGQQREEGVVALQINVLFLTGSFMKFFSFCKKCPGLRRQL